MGFITGTCVRSDYLDSDLLFDQWNRCNAIVLNSILTSLSQDVYLGHVFSDNVAKVWNELKETYDRIDGLIIFNLLQKVNSFKQGSLHVSEYYHKLNSLWREFDALTKLLDCTCEARNEVVDHDKLMKLMQFLMGLDDVYQPIKSNILTREILPEAKDAFVIISKEESHRGIPASSSKTKKPQVSAFNSKVNDNNKRKGSGNCSNGNRSGNWSTGNNYNRGNYDSLLCKNYGLKGHAVDRCFEIIGYPPGFKRNPNLKLVNNLNNNNRSNNSDVRGGFIGNNDKFSSPLSLSNEHMLILMSLLNNKSSRAANANMACIDNCSFFNCNVFFNQHFYRFYCANIKSSSKTPNESPSDDEEGTSVSREGSLHRPEFDVDNESGSDVRMHQPGHDVVIFQPGHGKQQTTTPIGEKTQSKGNFPKNNEVPTFQNVFENQKEEVSLRRSSRVSKLPAKLNHHVLNNTIKYGLRRKATGSKWVYRIKYMSSGEIEIYKARLVAKGFNQREGIDHEETFSPVVKMSTVRCLIDLAIQNDWKLFQMDVNNAFLYGSLTPRQWNHKLYETFIEVGFELSKNDHSLYIKNDGDVSLYLLVYVDDLVITENSEIEIEDFKSFLNKKFKIKELGELKYFLACRSVVTPLPENIVLSHKHMHAPLQSHSDLGLRMLKYLKLAPGIGINFTKSNTKFNVIAYSDSNWAKCPVTRGSVSGYSKAEYRAMASATCKVMWVLKILKDLGQNDLTPMALNYDNKSAIQIATNPVIEKTKHFDIDVHLVREKVASGHIKTMKVDSKDQVADVFTKALGSVQHNALMKRGFSGDSVFMTDKITGGEGYECCEGWKVEVIAGRNTGKIGKITKIENHNTEMRAEMEGLGLSAEMRSEWVGLGPQMGVAEWVYLVAEREATMLGLQSQRRLGNLKMVEGVVTTVYPSLSILDINYFCHFLDILRNYDPIDDEPMWAADRVVALTPSSAITIPETANEFAIKGNIIKIFYHGLSEITQEVLNAATSGIFLYKTPNQAYQLLEDKVLLKLDWAKNQKTKSSLKKTIAFADEGSRNSDANKIMARMDAYTIKMDAQYK
ncbi:ribonuclease H-like domain-containing protein [Tanacetum coccineum]